MVRRSRMARPLQWGIIAPPFSKSVAEEQFAAIQKKAKQALTEKEKARQERAEQVAGLRALRLAKEAADKEAAAQ